MPKGEPPEGGVDAFSCCEKGLFVFSSRKNLLSQSDGIDRRRSICYNKAEARKTSHIEIRAAVRQCLLYTADGGIDASIREGKAVSRESRAYARKICLLAEKYSEEDERCKRIREHLCAVFSDFEDDAE